MPKSPSRLPRRAEFKKLRAGRTIGLLSACCTTPLAAQLPAPTFAIPMAEIPVVAPRARLETAPVPSTGDAADDPGIWIHSTDSTKSLILGTDKKGGLVVYRMDGTILTVLDSGLRPNNIDVKYGIRFGNKTWDVAAAGTRGSGIRRGFKVWKIDPKTGAISGATPVIPVLKGVEPYGSTLYRRAKDGALFAFINTKAGKVEQHALTDDGRGGLRATLVRTWDVGKQVEGCVCDDEYGRFYIGEETVAIWRYDAEPNGKTGPNDRFKVIGVTGANRFKADVEGLTLYYGSRGGGYLLASIQGENRFFVFNRTGSNNLVKIFDPVASTTIDDVDRTDGVCVSNAPISAFFPRGIVILQDQSNTNPSANQNFKCYGWEDIAGQSLLIDTTYDPRRPKWRR